MENKIKGEGILLVDLGNSVTTVGVAIDAELVETWTVATRPELTCDEAELSILTFLNARLPAVQVVDAALCSVVPSLTSVWELALGRISDKRPMSVGPGLKSGLKMHLSAPTELGRRSRC